MSGMDVLYKENTIHILHLYIFHPCKHSWFELLMHMLCMYGLNNSKGAKSDFLASSQEKTSRWMKRRMRMSIWICSMIHAWTAILIQRRGSTTNWLDSKLKRIHINKSEVIDSRWKASGFFFRPSLLISDESPICKKKISILLLYFETLTRALCFHK